MVDVEQHQWVQRWWGWQSDVDHVDGNARRWIRTSLKRSWRWRTWRSQGRRLAQGCEDWANRAEEQVHQEGEKHLVHFGPFDQHGQNHHHHIHQYYHHQRCFTAQVVKEDMFKYSTTKLGKAMEKVQLLRINTWNCADLFWNLKIVVWNLNARCWSRTLCWTSRSTTSQTWRTVPTIRWAFYFALAIAKRLDRGGTCLFSGQDKDFNQCFFSGQEGQSCHSS